MYIEPLRISHNCDAFDLIFQKILISAAPYENFNTQGLPLLRALLKENIRETMTTEGTETAASLS